MTPQEALAIHLGLSIEDLREYRYQPTKSPCSIYAFESGYYTSTSGNNPKTNARFDQWKEVEDSYINSRGFKIFKHESKD